MRGVANEPEMEALLQSSGLTGLVKVGETVRRTAAPCATATLWLT